MNCLRKDRGKGAQERPRKELAQERPKKQLAQQKQGKSGPGKTEETTSLKNKKTTDPGKS